MNLHININSEDPPRCGNPQAAGTHHRRRESGYKIWRRGSGRIRSSPVFLVAKSDANPARDKTRLACRTAATYNSSADSDIHDSVGGANPYLWA